VSAQPTPADPDPLRIDALPRSVLALGARPGDVIAGCGGALALHAQRGDRVRAVALAAGAEELCEAAQAELRAAAMPLGVSDVACLPRAPGSLLGDFELAQRCRELLDGAELVYAPAPGDSDGDRRALAAAASALEGAGARLAFYALDAAAPGAPLDVGAFLSSKAEALERLGGDAPQRFEFDRLLARRVTGGESSAAELLDLPSAGSAQAVVAAAERRRAGRDLPRATAVISTWNKLEDVLANLRALAAQTRPFDDVVVVDNASDDGTADAIRAEFPRARLVVMPHSRYGACETFNIGFASARTELTAILDDDVLLSPGWLEGAIDRLLAEPESTAVLSTKVVEPGMPASYRDSPEVNDERYMSTFRGCASLARTHALREAGGYDERLFIYGNERDLTCRLLNLGYRVLQYPGVEVFHKTPFGIKMGKRSLFFHARNAWLAQLKYAPLGDLLRMPWLVLTKVLLRPSQKESQGSVHDATGTIGISRSIRETPGAWWILFKAAASVAWNLPYCLRRRAPCRADDFELPIE